MEHRVSDDVFYSDESGSSQEDSDKPTTDEGNKTGVRRSTVEKS